MNLEPTPEPAEREPAPAPPPQGVTPGFTIAWGCLIAAAVVVVQLAVATVLILDRFGTDLQGQDTQVLQDFTATGSFLAQTFLYIGPVAVVLVLLGVRWRAGDEWREFLGLTPPDPRALLRWALVVAAYLLVGELVQRFFEQSKSMEWVENTWATRGNDVVFWTSIVLLGPLAEEFVFRGLLLSGLRRSRVGDLGAILIGSLIWAVLHVQYDPFHIVSIFVLGVILGYARLRTGSLWSPIILHVANNLIGTVVMAFTATGG